MHKSATIAVMLPTALMILTAVLAVVGGWVIVRGVVGDRAKGRLRCPKCWYDMQGSPSLVCPECGHDAGDPKRLTRTRRRYRRVVAGLLLIGVAWYAMEVSYRVRFESEPISTAAVPTTWYAATYPMLDRSQRLLLIERLKRVRGNDTDVWTWQGWLLAKQAAWAIEREATGTPIRGDSFDLLAVVVGRTGCGGEEVLRLFDRTNLDDSERGVLIGSASTLWNSTRDWTYIRTIAGQLDTSPWGVAEAAISRPTADDYRLASDEDLGKLFDAMWHSRMVGRHAYTCWDHCLMAMQTRPALAEKLLSRPLSEVGPIPIVWNAYWVPPRTLEPLSVLCAIRGEPSPIRLVVEKPPIRWREPFGGPIIVSVHLAYTGSCPVYIKRTGDNDRERFRVLISDMDGRSVQTFPAPVEAVRFRDDYEGLRFERPLAFQFNIESHTRRPPPGKYQLRVQYHDRLPIAAMEDVSGLIIFESEPVELIVE